MDYLNRDELLLIHTLVIEQTGGSHGVREPGVIISLEDLPRQVVFGKELYPGHLHKAAVYARTIIMNHPYIDGNKRSGMMTALTFLENNGFIVVAADGEVEIFALEIVLKKLDIPQIAEWFREHSKKM